MSATERSDAIERGILGLYRSYGQQSQERRNWHADTCVDWSMVRADHSDAVHTIVEGFFGVEQYTPDYVAPLLNLLRRSFGRSQWHIRWGGEEQRHADLWRNAVLALGRRDESWINQYTDALREKEWRLPWESPLHMVFYQVIQERATQVSYHNLALAVSGELPRLVTPIDETLTKISRLIAGDEAAHYHFFVEIARLLLYYEPESSIEAFLEVVRKFTMPAREIMPGYANFGRVLHDTGVFGRTAHYRDVVQPVLTALCLPPVRMLEERVMRLREAAAAEPIRRTTAYLNTLDVAGLEDRIQSLARRNQTHLQKAGLSNLFRCDLPPAWAMKEMI